MRVSKRRQYKSSDRKAHHKMRLAVNHDSLTVRTAYLGGVTYSEIEAITGLPLKEIRTMVNGRPGPGGRESRLKAKDGLVMDKRYPPTGRKIA